MARKMSQNFRFLTVEVKNTIFAICEPSQVNKKDKSSIQPNKSKNVVSRNEVILSNALVVSSNEEFSSNEVISSIEVVSSNEVISSIEVVSSNDVVSQSNATNL